MNSVQQLTLNKCYRVFFSTTHTKWTFDILNEKQVNEFVCVAGRRMGVMLGPLAAYTNCFRHRVRSDTA